MTSPVLTGPRAGDAANQPDAREHGALQEVDALRTTLARITALRVAFLAGGAAAVAWIVTVLVQAAMSRAGGATASGNAWNVPALVLGVAAGVIAAALLWQRRGVVTLLRTALWIEERESSGFALVTLVDQATRREPMSAGWLSAATARSARALQHARSDVRTLARTQLTGPGVFLLVAMALAVFMPRGDAAARAGGQSGDRRDSAATTRRDVPIGAWKVRVVPPAYTGMAARELGDAASVHALVGTRIEVTGDGAVPDSVYAARLSDSTSAPTTNAAARVASATASTDALPVRLASSADGWSAQLIAPDGPAAVRVRRDRFARLLLVDGVADSIPRVMLTLPQRDSVLRTAAGALPLSAHVSDDIGLSRGGFEVIVSSGEGERFTVRTLTVGARSWRGDSASLLNASLDLVALKLGPGDVVHIRALARDANPDTSRGPGTSETRSFRIARASEYDSVAVEPAPPPEVDKSLLSQRMLLMLTERLEQKRPRMPVDPFKDESRKIARDQARLREAVGDAVFQRLTGESGGEERSTAAAADGKLALTGLNENGVLDEGDDSPVIAINKPLLEAYNAMWDAQRQLEQSDTRAAIPFMKIALAAIERSRAASRLYLRGKPPTVIVDLAKVRLAGKDTGITNERVPRPALPPRAAVREARLLAAAALAMRDAASARDSLAVLRLESLSDAPAFADALGALVERLSRSGAADLTELFLRARRVLGGIERLPATTWSRGGPP